MVLRCWKTSASGVWDTLGCVVGSGAGLKVPLRREPKPHILKEVELVASLKKQVGMI